LLTEERAETMSAFGACLTRLMERAEIASPGSLVERMQEAGNPEVSEEVLVALMHGESREMSPVFWVYMEEALGASRDELHILLMSLMGSYKPPRLDAYESMWKSSQALT
jgi:hypothetical protein